MNTYFLLLYSQYYSFFLLSRLTKKYSDFLDDSFATTDSLSTRQFFFFFSFNEPANWKKLQSDFVEEYFSFSSILKVHTLMYPKLALSYQIPIISKKYYSK